MVNEGLGWDSLKPNKVINTNTVILVVAGPHQMYKLYIPKDSYFGEKVCLSGDLTSKSFCGLIFFRNEKRDPGCLGDLLGIVIPSYVGIIININKPYKDSY